MRFGVPALVFLASISSTAAEVPVRQGGPLVPPTQGHVPRWMGTAGGLVGDSGPATGGAPGYGATEMNITNNLGIAPFCLNDQPITAPSGYRQTCFGADVGGQGGSITYNDYAFETPLPFTLQSANKLIMTSGVQQIALTALPSTTAGDVPVCIDPTTGRLFQGIATGPFVLTDDDGSHFLTDEGGVNFLTTGIFIPCTAPS